MHYLADIVALAWWELFDLIAKTPLLFRITICNTAEDCDLNRFSVYF